MQIAGIELATAKAQIKYANRDDVLLIKADAGTQITAIFTKNAFCAAPVLVCKENLSHNLDSDIYLLVNAGNANAGNGINGINDAKSYCAELARLANVPNYAVLPFSTGVIGSSLPVNKITAVLPALLADLEPDNWQKAASAIMTTDTYAKCVQTNFVHDGVNINLVGIAKGVGMICPDMATLLGFIATDAKIDKTILQALLVEVADTTFNSITVDGDTSTNDSLVLLATGKANNVMIADADNFLYYQFKEALHELSLKLAKMIIKDGEGATKLVTIEVQGGKTIAECRTVAYAVAHSPLVKTALYASDANWGRILAAVGYAQIEQLDVNGVEILIGNLPVVTFGMRALSYDEDAVTNVLKQDEFTITINLNRGFSNCQIYTCDLSHEYVSINASYRS